VIAKAAAHGRAVALLVECDQLRRDALGGRLPLWWVKQAISWRIDSARAWNRFSGDRVIP
jgi:hypothetical protein